jgi:hypothetical protein
MRSFAVRRRSADWSSTCWTWVELDEEDESDDGDFRLELDEDDPGWEVDPLLDELCANAARGRAAAKIRKERT